MQTTFTKSITPQFEQVGRRQKLVGQLGEIRDETGIPIHSQLYDTAPEAEIKLDALVRELLIDYAERGLVDELPEPQLVNWNSATAQIDPATAFTAQNLATNTGVPTYVVEQHGHYLIQDDQDLDCYGGRADIVATYRPEQPRAVTLTSIVIDQAAQRNRICPNCQGAHYGWQCPEIVARLFAPETDTSWKDIALGRELCRMKWKNFRAFVALLLSIPAEHLIIYAASYQAFVRSCRPDSDMTINQVLEAWSKDMRRGSDRGPATMSAAA
jgi:hypothetical protein